MEKTLGEIHNDALMDSSVEVAICVPRALLACCLDVLTECDKQVGVTGSNFDDDMALCIGNLKAFLKEPPTTR